MPAKHCKHLVILSVRGIPPTSHALQYTAQASVDDVLNTWRNHKSLQSTQTGLLTYGNGDGGGGPLAPMLENLRRCRAVANNTKIGGGEIPKVHMGATVEQFYDDLLKQTDKGEKLPVW